MDLALATEIVNECIAHKQAHGDFPTSQYAVINRYRKLAFKTVSDEYTVKSSRRVTFNRCVSVQYFDKNHGKKLGFL